MTHLECSLCSRKFEASHVWNLCECGGPLLARYDLARIRAEWSRESLSAGVNSMWRYAPVLPVRHQSSIISLGEGMTPLLPARRTGARIGANNLLIKDEGLNPTGSFKARGLSCAVSMCVELGVKALAIPSAGNAASALAAYAAAAGLEAHILMPADVPQGNFIECKAYGADVTLVDGPIGDCSRMVAERCATQGWFDISTLKEPCRIEGTKTMGYEIAEQLHWALPDAILCPAGCGIGMIGIWKAFQEMQALGWLDPQAPDSKRPKMIAVQAEGRQPIVRAFAEGAEASRFREGASTVASGLRMPRPPGDRLTLQAVRESQGCAIAIPDREIMDAALHLASEEGIFAAPEGAACAAAAERLIREGFLQADDQIVVFSTGSGLKYLEAYSVRFPRISAGAADKLGGLITPR